MWNKEHHAGRVGTDGGIIVARNPNKVRGPDVWFVSNARLPENIEKFWEVAPDLVAEIISPSDTANVIKSKLSDYFAAGTLLIWLVYPLFRQVETHSADSKITIFNKQARLETSLVPFGFRMLWLDKSMSSP
ncbi:MAG: Uma2 family endonuclease [Trueperaceae bacterium]